MPSSPGLDWVDQALTVPAMEVLRVQAQTIQHPILRPLQVDGREGFTPEEAGVLAVLVNPSLRAVRDQRQIASAQVLQAGLLPNPSLSGGLEVPFRGPDRFLGYWVGLDWDIASLVSRGAKLEAARVRSASVDLDVAWQEWQAAQSARLAACRRLSLEAQLTLAQKVDQALRENLAIVRQAVERQQKTAVDLATTEAASQEAHATMLSLQRDLRKQVLTLNRLLGLPADRDFPLRRDPRQRSRQELPAQAELLRGLESRRLDLLALRRGYESQDATVRAAVLGRFPKIELGVQHARDTGKNYTVGPSATVDLPIFDRNQGNIAIESATRRKLLDEYVNRVYEARSDIAMLLADAESVWQEVEDAERAVPVLERMVEIYQIALNAGQLDIISYYIAYGDLAKKRIELLKLRQEFLETWIALENAAGRYVTPGTPASAPATRPATHPAGPPAGKEVRP